MFEMLNKIDGVKDLKQLTIGELKILAEDIREALFNRLTKVGGHCGPNFGIVELEIALHYVFNSPKDKFVFDVSHQTYTHKMLTGRRLGFTDEEHFAEEFEGRMAEVDEVLYNIKKEEILARKRTKQIAEARQIAMYLSTEYLNIPLEAVGDIFGKNPNVKQCKRLTGNETTASTPPV